MSVISVSSISCAVENDPTLSSQVIPINAVTGIKLVAAQSGDVPSIPGYDLVTCIGCPTKPVCLESKNWIAISRDSRKSPITKFTLDLNENRDLRLRTSIEESFRIIGKPIYEIYGGDCWESFDKCGTIYHCQSWRQALEMGKIAKIPVSDSYFLVACLDPLYLLSDLKVRVKLENQVINPLLSSDGLESVPDIQSFIFPEGPSTRLYLPGGISFSGNVLTDAEGTRYHASHIYYYGKEGEGRLYSQCAITVISNFDSPCHDYFHPILLQILSGPRDAIEPLLTQLFLTRMVPSGFAGIPRDPYSEYNVIFELLSIPTMIDLFQALLLEERVIIIGDRVDTLDALILIMISFLYPLKWDGILISCVPKDLVHVILEAPCSSMFIGVLKDSFRSCFECYVETGHPFQDDLWIIDLTSPVPKLKKLASQKYQSAAKKSTFYEKWIQKRSLPNAVEQLEWENLPYGERLAHKLHWCRNKKIGPFAMRFSFFCLVLGILQNHSKYISYNNDDLNDDFGLAISIDLDRYLYNEGVPESWKGFFRKFLKGTMFLRFLIERAENHECFDFYEEISGRDLDDLWRDAYFHTLETFYCHNCVIQKCLVPLDANIRQSSPEWDNEWIGKCVKEHFSGENCNGVSVFALRPRSKSNSIVISSKANVSRSRSRTIMIARRAPSRQNALTTTCAVSRFMTEIFLIWLKTHKSLLTFSSAYQAWNNFLERIHGERKLAWIPSISKIYSILATLTDPGSVEEKIIVREFFQTFGRKITKCDLAVTVIKSPPPESTHLLNSLEFTMICSSCGRDHSFMDYLMSLGLDQISCRFCTSKIALDPFVNGHPLLPIANGFLEDKMIPLLHADTLLFLTSLMGDKISSSVLKFNLYFSGYIDSEKLIQSLAQKQQPIEFFRNALLSLKSHLFGQAIKHLLFSRKPGSATNVSQRFSLFWLLASLNELDFEEETLYKIPAPRIPLSRLLREYLKIICYIEPCLLQFYDPLLDAAPSFVSISVYSQFYGHLYDRNSFNDK